MLMVPECIEDDWYEFEMSNGEFVVIPAEFLDPYLDAGFHAARVSYTGDQAVRAWTRRHAWGVRMTAPGYLDATDWLLFDNREEALDQVGKELAEVQNGLMDFMDAEAYQDFTD